MSTIIGWARPRRASAAALSARDRSAGVSLASMPETVRLSSAISLSKRLSGVVCPSMRMIMAASPPPIASSSSRARALAMAMRVRGGPSSSLSASASAGSSSSAWTESAPPLLPSPPALSSSLASPSPAGSANTEGPPSRSSVAFIDAEASRMMTTLRASRSSSPRRGSMTAKSSSARMTSWSSSDSSRLSFLNRLWLSFSASTRCHSAENGTSKRRRRILRM